MSKRFQNAQAAQNGACNPRAIAKGLVDAIDECRAENIDPSLDPAVFLILDQLKHILSHRGVSVYADTSELDAWREAMDSVNAKLESA